MPSANASPMVIPPEFADKQHTPDLQPERNIGARIKGQREKLGLNFEEFSALTREYDAEGIAAVTLRRYERTDDGRSFPDLRSLRILVDVLDVPADYLIAGRKQNTAEVEKWNQFKGIIKQIAHEDGAPDTTGERWGAYERSEKLIRARLHTKK